MAKHDKFSGLAPTCADPCGRDEVANYTRSTEWRSRRWYCLRIGSGASERKLEVGRVGVAEDFLVEGHRKVAEGRY